MPRCYYTSGDTFNNTFLPVEVLAVPLEVSSGGTLENNFSLPNVLAVPLDVSSGGTFKNTYFQDIKMLACERSRNSEAAFGQVFEVMVARKSHCKSHDGVVIKRALKARASLARWQEKLPVLAGSRFGSWLVARDAGATKELHVGCRVCEAAKKEPPNKFALFQVKGAVQNLRT